MASARAAKRDETFDQWRQRMLDETGRYIEWGLRHPEQVQRIPIHPVGRGSFPERLKTLFWSIALERASRNQDE